MALSVSNIGDNPQQPGIWAEAYIPDQLIAGNLKLVTQPIVLQSGTLPRGSVLGAQTTFSMESAAGTNTGNGTIGSLTLGTGYEFGTYVLTATSSSNFTVTSPEGIAQAAATVGSAYSHQIGFTITAGGTAFVAGDSFTVQVLNATGNYVLSTAGASDGSQNPSAILVDAADASGGPVKTGAYVMGEFNANALNFDSSWTLSVLRSKLQPLGIFLKSAVSAADPVSAS